MKDKVEISSKDTEKVPTLTSKRWILAYIGFFGFFCLYSLRVNISVAIVCMVKDEVKNETSVSSNTSHGDSCVDSDSGGVNEDLGEFYWDKTVQSFVLSSFFYGYIVTQVPGGWLAGLFGGKRVLGLGILITAIATILTPEAARYDWKVVVALRALMGLSEGVAFPAMHTMLGKWSPIEERTRLASLTYSGLNLGNILTYMLSGVLCAYGFDNGWASIFYLCAIISFVWVAAWFYLVSDDPEDHPTISKAELDHIIHNRGEDTKTKEHGFKVPWLAIMKSRAMWACLTAHFCNNWLHYTLLTGLPTFMKEVLKYDIKENGVLSAMPYIAMIIVVLIMGHVVDYIRSHWLSTTVTRKIFQSLAFVGSGACIVGVGFINCEHRVIAVILLTVAVGFEGLNYSGYMVNQVDFAPRYAGILFGINNFISTIPGILAPMVTGALTPNKTQEEWRTVFYVCSVFCLVGIIGFGCFASGELEPWAVDENETELDVDQEADDEKKNSAENGTASSEQINRGFEMNEKM